MNTTNPTTNPNPKITMNEKTNTPETLAAILAEMRRFAAFAAGRSRITPAPSLAAEQECHAAKLTEYADRIEAAYKREHAEWHAETDAAKEERNRIACRMRGEFAAKCRACKAEPGNAAAMRAALERIRHEYGWGRIGCRTCVSSDADVERVSDLFEKQIDAALAAPARNCDRFPTRDEAVREYLRLSEPGANGATTEGIVDWLFAPAEGGDHA